VKDQKADSTGFELDVTNYDEIVLPKNTAEIL